MRQRSNVFGEVAGVYDGVRPGYPDELVSAVLAAAAGVTSAVEVGAGTGKGTEAFVRRGVAVHCVEPDARMAAVLRARFAGAGVGVQVARFEDWRAPAGGVRLLYCAQAWHFMDRERRCALAYAALAPGGVLALFGHDYRFADQAMYEAEVAVFAAHAPELLGDDPAVDPPPHRHWLAEDVTASGLFTGVRAARFDRVVAFPTARYLDLKRTFSPVRMVAEPRREAALGALGAAVEAAGGVVRLRLRTALVTARRPG